MASIPDETIALPAGHSLDDQPVDDQPVKYLTDPVDGVQLVTIPDAAKLMGCSARTVHGWVARALVEIRRTPTGQARIVVSSLWKRSPADGDSTREVAG